MDVTEDGIVTVYHTLRPSALRVPPLLLELRVPPLFLELRAPPPWCRQEEGLVEGKAELGDGECSTLRSCQLPPSCCFGVSLQHISLIVVHCTEGVLCIWMPLVCCTSLPLHCGGVVWPWCAARVYHFTAVYTSLRRCSLAAHLHQFRTLARVGVLQQVVVVVGNSTHGFSSLKIANLSSGTRGKCVC